MKGRSATPTLPLVGGPAPQSRSHRRSKWPLQRPDPENVWLVLPLAHAIKRRAVLNDDIKSIASYSPNISVGALQQASSCFPPASPNSVEGAGKQKMAPRRHHKSLNYNIKYGAGEEIRTLDPNLGNRIRRSTLQQAITRHCAKKHDVSSAFIDTCSADNTLAKPATRVLLLPPCFPGHAAPAWGSRWRRVPDARSQQAADLPQFSHAKGVQRCLN